MAIEAKRGCGYRKVGGLYLVSGQLGEACPSLPHELTVCPCCGQGIKQALGWTWIDPMQLFGKPANVVEIAKRDSSHASRCVVCTPSLFNGAKAGLMWVGEKFYKTPGDFLKEGVEMGVSKRIKAIPRDFIVGETYVLLAHPKAVHVRHNPPIQKENDEGQMEMVSEEFKPGIFSVFRPTAVEMLITEKQATKTKLKELEKRGIKPIVVPNDDADHQGSVNDSKKTQKKLAEKILKDIQKANKKKASKK